MNNEVRLGHYLDLTINRAHRPYESLQVRGVESNALTTPYARSQPCTFIFAFEQVQLQWLRCSAICAVVATIAVCVCFRMDAIRAVYFGCNCCAMLLSCRFRNGSVCSVCYARCRIFVIWRKMQRHRSFWCHSIWEQNRSRVSPLVRSDGNSHGLASSFIRLPSAFHSAAASSMKIWNFLAVDSGSGRVVSGKFVPISGLLAKTFLDWHVNCHFMLSEGRPADLIWNYSFLNACM